MSRSFFKGKSNTPRSTTSKNRSSLTPSKSPSRLLAPNTMRRAFSSPEPADNKRQSSRHQKQGQWPSDDHHTNFKFSLQNTSSLFYQNLISITLIDNKSKSAILRLQSELHSELVHGWDISRNINGICYKLKPLMQRIMVVHDLNDVLLYSFNHFLDLTECKPSSSNDQYPKKNKNMFQWVSNSYLLLIKSLTLEQKAMIFCKCSDRKTRKYKLIHEYKDCIIGKEGVDFLVNKRICKNRKAAVSLGQEFIDKGYMSHVCDKHRFKDSNNLWYKFYDDAIKYANDNFKRYSDDEKMIIDEEEEEDELNENEETDDDESMVNQNEAKEDQQMIVLIENVESNESENKIKIQRLGKRHHLVMKWLLSLYSKQELQSMMNLELRQLINSPYVSLPISRSVDCQGHDQTDDDEDAMFGGCTLDSPQPHKVNHYQQPQGALEEELFMSYQNRMALQMSNKYKLNVKPFSMRDITNAQRKKLLTVQGMKFDSYLKALEFVFCELWDIYNDIICGCYMKLIEGLSLVEKAKMMSIGVERKNRLKNLHKYRNCFVGSEAVSFLLNAKLVEDRKNGVYLGNLFCKKKWVKHVKNEHALEDKDDLFYVVIEDEIENRLDELRLYRKQQASNHVNISLDIVTSPKSPIRVPDNYKTGGIIKLLSNEEGEDSDEILYDYHESTKSVFSQSVSILEYISQKQRKSTSLEGVESYFDEQ